MERIFKWNLKAIVGEIQPIEMPLGSEVIGVGVQNDTLVIWTRHTEDQTETETLRFEVHWTGHSRIPDDYIYHGTAITANGLIWHIHQVM